MLNKAISPIPPAPFPLGRGMNSENKREAVLWHRFTLVFGIHLLLPMDNAFPPGVYGCLCAVNQV
jgi:hypothetical protein